MLYFTVIKVVRRAHAPLITWGILTVTYKLMAMQVIIKLTLRLLVAWRTLAESLKKRSNLNLKGKQGNKIGLKGKSVNEKHAVRQEYSVPLLKEFKQWLDRLSEQVPPKSAIGIAVNYSRNQWHTLTVYVEDGHLAIDNNHAERAVKPFVISHKNWVFSNTANGADASAVLYSIIETAKANGFIPFDYLMYSFEHLATGSDDIDAMLPWNIDIS